MFVHHMLNAKVGRSVSVHLTMLFDAGVADEGAILHNKMRSLPLFTVNTVFVVRIPRHRLFQKLFYLRVHL